MITYLPNDILMIIIDVLDFKDRCSLFCSNKCINQFAIDYYFKYEITANKISFIYITKNINTLHTLILSEDINITDELLISLSKLKHLELAKNKNITDLGLSYIPSITNLNLESNKNITVVLALQNLLRKFCNAKTTSRSDNTIFASQKSIVDRRIQNDDESCKNWNFVPILSQPPR